MRSIVITCLLLVVALGLLVLSFWKVTHGNFNRFLGSQVKALDGMLYPEFQPEEIVEIQIDAPDSKLALKKQGNEWLGATSWLDRADPRAVYTLLQYTKHLKVQDYAPRSKVNEKQAGLGGKAVYLKFVDGKGKIQAHYKIGAKSPWLNLGKEDEEPLPTRFILPLASNEKHHVYLATGDVNMLFMQSLKFLRDHHPFYFHPNALNLIKIQSKLGEITLEKSKATQTWEIIKPLQLKANAARVKELIEGLFQLQATSILDDASASNTFSALKSHKPIQITLQKEGNEPPVTLEIFPLEKPSDKTLKARVSNREGVLLELPVESSQNKATILTLPLTLDQLRDQTLYNLNVAAIDSIVIQSATSQTISLSRPEEKQWIATINGISQPANEMRMFDLLNAMKNTKVQRFETDAATDLKPWGLNKPILKIKFYGKNKESELFNFGMNLRGELFANREGSNTVMKLDERFLEEISIQSYEWRSATLWKMSRFDLIGLNRDWTSQNERLKLKYDYISESWEASRDGQDITFQLDVNRANYFIEVLEKLSVAHWLSPEDLQAADALSRPSMSIQIFHKGTTDLGELNGINMRTLTIAPNPNDARYYYGRLSTEKCPFLLDVETFNKLSVNMLEKF